MNEKHTTRILFGPSASGKSTRTALFPDALLIDRDEIRAKMRLERQLSPGDMTDDQRLSLHFASEEKWFEAMETAFKNKTPQVIIDYIPQGPDYRWSKHPDWATIAIGLSRKYERNVEIDGVFCEPEILLQRYLERDSKTLPFSGLKETTLNKTDWSHDRLLQSVLFHDQFPRLAALADRATLFDNSGSAPIQAALWEATKLTVLDPVSYRAFERLHLIAFSEAHCEPSMIGPVPQPGDMNLKFSVKIIGLYGKSEATIATRPVGKTGPGDSPAPPPGNALN